MEVWEKRAHSLVAINSHADLFSSAAYQCLQQDYISVNCLSRLLEVVAKSVFVTELIQARCDVAIASSEFFWIILVMH